MAKTVLRHGVFRGLYTCKCQCQFTCEEKTDYVFHFTGVNGSLAEITTTCPECGKEISLDESTVKFLAKYL